MTEIKLCQKVVNMQNKDFPELRNCPFCGKSNAEIYYPYYTDTYCCIQCYECYCTTALFKTTEEAAEAWNRRADND